MKEKICGGLFIAAALTICALPIAKQTASASTVQDVTDSVSATGWIDHQELKVTCLDLGEGVEPDIGYGMIDGAYAYAQEYIAINGRTVKEINSDTTLGATAWTYTVFPSTLSNAIYKVPVMLQVNNDKIEIKIHDNYVETLGDSVEITAKAGLYFENNSTRYEVTEDKTFTVFGEQRMNEVDITEDVTIDGWDITGDAQELTYTRIHFGEGVLPSDIDFHILDDDNGTQYHYIKDYITVNGKTVGQINTETDVSNYVFSSFPSNAAAKYKLPIILFENTGVLEVKIHNDYLKTLEGDLEIALKAGFYVVNGNTKYTVSNDILHTIEGMNEVDITSQISIEGWFTAGDAQELTYTMIYFPEGALPTLSFDMMDKAAWLYMQEYIAINGKTVKEINTETDTSTYQFSTFPSTEDNPLYKVPVILHENGDCLEVKIHNSYLATIKEDIVISLEAGFSILVGNTKYTVSEDVSLVVEAISETDIAQALSMKSWSVAGDKLELTYTRIYFPEGVLPEDLDYHVIDMAAWTYLQDYILINGKTIREINTTTDVSGYEFSTFPSTESNPIYKVPVIIFENNNALELKFHNTYLQSVEGELEITVKEGLFILGEGVRYVVSKDVRFGLTDGVWADKDRLYKVTYFVNGQKYGEAEEYPYRGQLVLRDAVDAGAGYEFGGWQYTATSAIVQDMEIHGYVKPIRYTITYHLNGGVNASTNPIVYYVTDGEIVLKDAQKEGATFKGWYLSEDYSQKVEKLSAEQLGDLNLYALFEESAEKKGCGSSTMMGGGTIAILSLALFAKKRKNEE